MSSIKPSALHDSLSEILLITECVYMATEALGGSEEVHAPQSVLNVVSVKVRALMELAASTTKEAIVMKSEA